MLFNRKVKLTQRVLTKHETNLQEAALKANIEQMQALNQRIENGDEVEYELCSYTGGEGEAGINVNQVGISAGLHESGKVVTKLKVHVKNWRKSKEK